MAENVVEEGVIEPGQSSRLNKKRFFIVNTAFWPYVDDSHFDIFIPIVGFASTKWIKLNYMFDDYYDDEEGRSFSQFKDVLVIIPEAYHDDNINDMAQYFMCKEKTVYLYLANRTDTKIISYHSMAAS